MNQTSEFGNADARWQGLYKLGGIAAFVIAVLLVGETVVYSVFPRATTALEHLQLFHDNWLVGLLTFDLLGMIAYVLFVPMILALYVVLRRAGEAWMAVGTVLFFVGIAAFFADNTAFPMLSLSDQYARATTDVERAMLLATAQAMLTLFNENAFLTSYLIVSAAWTLIAAVMLRSSLFSRFIAWSGILAGSSGIIAIVFEHAGLDVLFVLSILFYFAAIIFLFIWVILAGRRLYQLGTVAGTSGH